MPFYIFAERAVKLVDRFKSFEADRAIVHARMEQYRPRLPRVSVAPAAARADLRELFREGLAGRPLQRRKSRRRPSLIAAERIL